MFFSIFDWSKRWNLGFWRSVHLFVVHIFPSVSSVKSVSGPMTSTATFEFGLQISKSHGSTKGGGGCRSKLHGSKVHGVRARTPGYMIWNKGSFASVKHLLNENMSIQHLKKLSDPKKISFEKFEMKEKCMGVRARTPFLGQKCTAYKLVRQYNLNILVVFWLLFGISLA